MFIRVHPWLKESKPRHHRPITEIENLQLTLFDPAVPLRCPRRIPHPVPQSPPLCCRQRPALEFGHSARQRRAGISAQGKRGSAPPWVKIPEGTGALQGRSPCSARHPWQSDPVAPSPAASAGRTPIGRRPCRAAEDFARTTQGGSRFAGLPWAGMLRAFGARPLRRAPTFPLYPRATLGI